MHTGAPELRQQPILYDMHTDYALDRPPACAAQARQQAETERMDQPMDEEQR
jgi:hypothetical protein